LQENTAIKKSYFYCCPTGCSSRLVVFGATNNDLFASHEDEQLLAELLIWIWMWPV
jgi:hypothetical protein